MSSSLSNSGGGRNDKNHNNTNNNWKNNATHHNNNSNDNSISSQSGRDHYHRKLRREDESYPERRGYNIDDTTPAVTAAMNNNEWKCLECSTWNRNMDTECQHCHYIPIQYRRRGRSFDDNYYHHNAKRYRSPSGGWHSNIDHESDTQALRRRGNRYDDDDDYDDKPALYASNNNTNNDDELDEFGRIKSTKKITSKKKCIRYPPCFDTNGSSYVLDTRSGMFYESICDFFYDPKSKLYYSNQLQTYYQYDKVQEKYIMIPSDSNQSTDSAHNTTTSTLNSTTNVSENQKKKSILINLKTKSLKSETLSSGAIKASKKKDVILSREERSTDPVIVPDETIVSKRHEANIEKWSERQKEIRQELNATSLLKNELGNEQTRNDKIKVQDESMNGNITTTAKGEPICLLCRRRFPTIDKLRYHESASTLHKENLMKEQQKNSTTADPSSITLVATVDTKSSNNNGSTSTTYIDRAEQRRKLHEPSERTVEKLQLLHADFQQSKIHNSYNDEDNSIDSTNPTLTQSSNTNSTATSTTAGSSTHTTVAIDESNIGHQMLQRLGWKSGKALGRTSSTELGDSSRDDGVQPPPKKQKSNDTSLSMIKQDWDRIESISKSSGTSLHKKGIGR